jgi:Domain of unknown function (DUF4333)
VSRRLLAPVVVLTLLGAAGCSSARVTASDVAGAVADQVETQTGARPEVQCPEDLEAEVGATARCTLTLEGVQGEFGVTARVTRVEDGQASFDIAVDEEPRG